MDIQLGEIRESHGLQHGGYHTTHTPTLELYCLSWLTPAIPPAHSASPCLLLVGDYDYPGDVFLYLCQSIHGCQLWMLLDNYHIAVRAEIQTPLSRSHTYPADAHDSLLESGIN